MSEDKKTEGMAGGPLPEGGVGDDVAGAEQCSASGHSCTSVRVLDTGGVLAPEPGSRHRSDYEAVDQAPFPARSTLDDTHPVPPRRRRTAPGHDEGLPDVVDGGPHVTGTWVRAMGSCGARRSASRDCPGTSLGAAPHPGRSRVRGPLPSASARAQQLLRPAGGALRALRARPS